MLLDDSIELDYYNYSASAEPLPMNWDIDLPKIWIPSSLLPNRRKQMSANENKSFMSHTLEKPDYSKTFSAYAEEGIQYHKSQASSAVPHKIGHHNNSKNNDIDESQEPQALPSSQNTMKWDEITCAQKKKDISPGPSVNSIKSNDFLRNSQLDDPLIRNSAHGRKKTLDTYSEQKIRGEASLGNLTHRMAEILSEDEPFKEHWNHENAINTSADATSSILDSIPPSAKDSLEELYFSDEDENQFDMEENKFLSLEMKSPMDEHTHNIYIDNSDVQEIPSECFVNNMKALEITKNSSDKILSRPFEEIQKIPSEEQKLAFDDAFNQIEKYRSKEIESVVHTKDFVQKLPNSEEESQDTAEQAVEYFPVAYKRPPLQESVNKIKPQKEKKKAKKGKISIPLEDLFQKEEVDRFKIPEVDEFYENLVRQGICQPRHQMATLASGMDPNPFENVLDKQETNAIEFSTENSPNKLQHLFWDSAQVNLSSEPQFSSPDKFQFARKEEKDASLDTLIIDNIPLNVSKENIESFVLGFGELKYLTIQCCGRFQRAELQMDAICDIDWIIDCLNDSQPFGSSEAELIKCYRQT